MKAKEIEALESYFKTENEYWNGYTRKILCEYTGRTRKRNRKQRV